MKITCLDKQVGQLLKESFYRIPRFQRPYSWDQTNVEDFWRDAVQDNDSQYFIGNFVVYDAKSALGVVDGQQRLTTITLLLCALRNAFENEELSNLSRGIHGLIERRDISDQQFYVLQTETSYPYFQEHIQKFGGKPGVPDKPGLEEELLKKAFLFFRSKIDEVIGNIKAVPSLSKQKQREKVQEELCKIRDKVLDLKLIFTSLDNDDDAYVIFETLNTRGKDLTLSDLVKGHLSRLLKPSNSGVDLAKDKWNSIQKNFEASQADLSVSTFIHHFWLSRYEYITEKNLYKALRKRITKENASEFLNDLVKESVIYRYIHEPAARTWKKEESQIRDSLRAMNLFRIRQQLPLVLSVMRHHEDQTLKIKHVRNILEALENFHFIFTAISSQRSSGGISFMYALTARDLHAAENLEKKAKVLSDFQKNKLLAKLPQFSEFQPGFLDLLYSNAYSKQKPLVRYILTKMYQKNSEGLPLDAEQVTIEHISPQSQSKRSPLSPEQVASIGNLMLLSKTLNSDLANKSFAEKVAVLTKCKVWVDKAILQATDWGATEIANRAQLLSREAYDNIWTL